MSWSLQVTNGDLSFGSNGLNTVSGSGKMVQDISGAILTPLGYNDIHPEYGSTIEDAISGPNDSSAATFVDAEIQRICQWYQNQQIARNDSDIATYGRSTLTVGEALLAVQSTQFTSLEDVLRVLVTLTTGNGNVQTAVMVS